MNAPDAGDHAPCSPAPATASAPAIAESRKSHAVVPDWHSHRFLGLARIDESRCIGCMLCIRACPVDAIVGRARRMHTVLAAECTGCGLCLPPCPMDCIALMPTQPPRAWTEGDALRADARTQARVQRIARESREPTKRRPGSGNLDLGAQDGATIGPEEIRQGRHILQQAMERARARRAAR
ncbi:electron transport complex, RnfABCDGE type, B subunit [Burkholderiales bacterium GJ-E10]|nr:electron transport complex, RnfABCDGE type, B subunit [Burkholderiales bacterium GJ-E10]